MISIAVTVFVFAFTISRGQTMIGVRMRTDLSGTTLAAKTLGAVRLHC